MNESKISEGKKCAINLGLIGAGNFATKYHLPSLKDISEFNLVAIAGRTGSKIEEIGKAYGVGYVTTDANEIIDDERIDSVMIATRHNLHATSAIIAIRKGKNVFLEKPMCLTIEELESLTLVAEQCPQKFTIGFNRRFSEISKTLKSLLDQESGPMIISYRVAGTFAPADSWMHDPNEGGGAIIGECCHFFDYIYWLSGEAPIRLFAEGGNLTHPGHNIFDNVIITIMLSGGSVGVITYSDMGNEQLPKERVEILCGGKAAIIDDFTALTLRGFTAKDIRLEKQDKGFKQQLQSWRDAILNKRNPEVILKDAFNATLSTFKTLDALKTHLPQDIRPYGK